MSLSWSFAQQFLGISSKAPTTVQSICAGPAGVLYVTGGFEKQVDVIDGAGQSLVQITTFQDFERWGYVMLFSEAGNYINHLVFKSYPLAFADSPPAMPIGIAVSKDHVFLTGTFGGGAFLDATVHFMDKNYADISQYYASYGPTTSLFAAKFFSSLTAVNTVSVSGAIAPGIPRNHMGVVGDAWQVPPAVPSPTTAPTQAVAAGQFKVAANFPIASNSYVTITTALSLANYVGILDAAGQLFYTAVLELELAPPAAPLTIRATCCDALGNIYVTGNGGASNEVVVIKFASDGTIRWILGAQTLGATDASTPYGIAATTKQSVIAPIPTTTSVYVTGSFVHQLQFPGTNLITSQTENAFVLRVDDVDDVPTAKWLRQGASASPCRGRAVAIRGVRVVVFGEFRNSISWKSNLTVVTIDGYAKTSTENGFVVELDSSGSIVGSNKILAEPGKDKQPAGRVYAKTVAVTTHGTVVVGGDFSGAITCGAETLQVPNVPQLGGAVNGFLGWLK